MTYTLQDMANEVQKTRMPTDAKMVAIKALQEYYKYLAEVGAINPNSAKIDESKIEEVVDIKTMKMNELRQYAKHKGVDAPVGITKEELIKKLS